MNMIDSFHKHPSKPDWQFLGALKLPVGGNTNNMVDSWLMELLGSINLPEDFLNRVLASAQSSVARAMQSTTVMELRHVHLSIFIPQEYELKGKNWGYFHIERIEDQVDRNISHEHTVDFYLYLEGE